MVPVICRVCELGSQLKYDLELLFASARRHLSRDLRYL